MIALARHAAHAVLTAVFERWMRLVVPALMTADRRNEETRP